MDILKAIKEAPEWVAVIIAAGGLSFQQVQITNLTKRLNKCHDFMAERVGELERELSAVYRKLLKKTDI